jgi:hypothetical protein
MYFTFIEILRLRKASLRMTVLSFKNDEQGLTNNDFRSANSKIKNRHSLFDIHFNKFLIMFAFVLKHVLLTIILNIPEQPPETQKSP